MTRNLDDLHPIEREADAFFNQRGRPNLRDLMLAEGITDPKLHEEIANLILLFSDCVGEIDLPTTIGGAMLLGIRLAKKGLV